jgi:hypothetical protein
MKKLPEGFRYSMYDVAFRFVEEADADFILQLRTDKRKAKYISRTIYDVERQKDWIREYKQREKAGSEYYFFITCGNAPTGVIRLYNIHDGSFEVGSIVLTDKAPIHCVLATTIMAKEIAFELLELDLEISETYADNKHVVKLQKSWNKKLVETRFDDVGENLLFNLTRDDYFLIKPKKVRQLRMVISE